MQNKTFKILIIRFSSLGDVLLTTPLIRLLRKKYQKAQIDFLVRKEYSQIVRYNPHLSKILEFDVKEGFEGLKKLKNEIWRNKYHVILDLQRNLRSSYLTFGRVINKFSHTDIFKVKKNQIIRFLLVKWKVNLYKKMYSRIIPVWEKYVRTAQKLEIVPDEGQLELFPSDDAQRQTDRFLNNLPAGDWHLVIAPGAKHITKRWPTDYFTDLILQLYNSYKIKTLLIGGEQDNEVIEDILEGIPRDIALSTAGKFTLLETAVIIKKAKLVISNDSGLMHVATAFNRPLIAIFGSTVEEFGFFPNNPNAITIENKGLYCRPCSHIGRTTCPEKHFKCMKEIKPKTILDLIEKMRIF